MTGETKPISALGQAFPPRLPEDGRAATWVDAFVPVGKDWKRRIFKTEEIQRIESAGSKSTHLCLYDGTSVPVLMDASALWQKIFAPDFRSGGEPISLLSVTGPDAFPLPYAPEMGTLVKGEGVYIGRYEPMDGQGKSLGKIFNVYAASEDLTKDISCNAVLKKLRELKNWHGYDGSDYATSVKIIFDLISGSYKGGWVIPPLEIVEAGNQEASLFKCRNSGVLYGTLDEKESYITSTMTKDAKNFHGVKMEDGGLTSFDPTFTSGRSCRPVRLVEIKPGY